MCSSPPHRLGCWLPGGSAPQRAFDNPARPAPLHALHCLQKSNRSGLLPIPSVGGRVQPTAQYPSRHRSNRSPKCVRTAVLALATNLERRQQSRAIFECDSQVSPRRHLFLDCKEAKKTLKSNTQERGESKGRETPLHRPDGRRRRK